MEISQGISLCSYLYLKQEKVFFYLFSSIKSENKRAEQVVWEKRTVTSGTREEMGKRAGRVIWYKNCVYMYASMKIIPVESIPGIGAGGIKKR
jgi:hypothetical protein